MKLLTSSKNLIEELSRINITRSEEVIEYLPYRYEEFFYAQDASFKDKQRVVILGKVVSTPRSFNKGAMNIITFHVVDQNNHLYNCKIFNRPFYMGMLEYGVDLTIVATYQEQRKELNVINIKKGEIPSEERLKPLYHLPSGVNQTTYANLVRRTLDKSDELVDEILPNYLLDKYRLLSHVDALKLVHFPKKKEDIALGLRTLKFEECLEYCFKNRIIREQNKKISKNVNVDFDLKKINEFILNLKYKLTKDQTQAVKEIVLDIKSSKVMYRLLQGDVGTGKTIVAIISLYANYLRGRQGVLLAPTDSLARQHYESLNQELSKYGIRTALLIGDMKAKEKSELKEQIERGEIDVIVGTHAVFSKNVNYHSLGLAIVDEQHRFGVNQRNMLVGKGEDVDLLLMSATPIPRTLALSIYGDLDISSLTMYPKERREVITKVVDYDSPKIQSMIDYLLGENRQIFIVCPKIHLGGFNKSSEEIYDLFKPIYGDKIALLHGKMDNNEKIETLDKFRNNEIKILVSTTVVELGIDVKTAGGMIIYSANSFGLASLHQLRGRVGRDGQKAYCLLVDHFEEDEDSSRLKFLESCSDGFEISEEDMKRRGPGDFIGVEQSGFPDFNSLNIVSDFKMFEVARDEITYMFNNPNVLGVQKYYDHCLKRIEEEEIVTLID